MTSSKKRIILFDIDYTLFNAKQFRESFFRILANRIPHADKQILLNTLQQVYEKAKEHTSFFDPKTYLDLLEKSIPHLSEKRMLEKAIMNEVLFEESLYEETKQVLHRLAKDGNVLLGIFSWGNIPVQRAKIKLLEKYLHKDHIHIIEFDKRTMLPKLLQRYADWEVYLIDDYQEVLRDAKKLKHDLYTIWIKRGETEGKRNNFENFTPDSIIGNLSEVLPLLEGE